MERVSVSLRESGESQSFVERQRQEIEGKRVKEKVINVVNTGSFSFKVINIDLKVMLTVQLN